MFQSTKRLKTFGNLAYIFSVALVIASLLTSLVPPRIASAHHPSVSGRATCQQDGTYLVTWTINNWSGTTLPMTITAINRTIGVSVGTVVATSIQGSETLPGTTSGDLTLTVSGSWSNGATGTTTSAKVQLKGDCKPPPPPDYQLNLSHIECVNGQVEIHFVLLNVPDGITPGTLTYTYGTIVPGNHTGNVWHYTDYKPDGNFDIQSASVVVNGVTVTLHNPGAYAGNYQCAPKVATASVSVGQCTWSEAGGSQTAVTLTLSHASLSINGTTYTTSQTINLPPGTYPYTWTALPSYTGSGSGSAVVGDCTPPNATASVSIGQCTWDEEDGSLTAVTLTLSGASLTINGVTYTSSQTINLPPGTYPYTWTALAGYKGSGSGSVVIGDCTPGNASASVSTGQCTWDEEEGSMTSVTIDLTGASFTIDGQTYTTSQTINLPPGTYPYSWTALPGYKGSGSGSLVIGECIPPPVPTATIVCYTLEFESFKLNVGNSGPSGLIGYSTNLDATIVSLGTIANGGSTELLVPGDVTTLYLYPSNGAGGWGTPVEVELDKATTRACEKDPMGLESFCSYIDLDKPVAWHVTNLNNFSVAYTWVYGSESSIGPVTLPDYGYNTSFLTSYQPGEIMRIFVNGVEIVSLEHEETCEEFIPLTLTGVCSNDPASTHGWSATNPNAFDVDAEWRVNGSSLTGLLNIPANSSAQFTTPVFEGSIVQIYAGGEEQDNASAAQGCLPPENPPDNPPETPPLVPPVTGGQTPVLIPVTGLADNLSGLATSGMLNVGFGFFGLGMVLHGFARRRSKQQA